MKSQVILSIAALSAFPIVGNANVNAVTWEAQTAKKAAQDAIAQAENIYTTGITSITAEKLKNAVIYNMNGVRVDKISGKGLYIVNGKKMFVK